MRGATPDTHVIAFAVPAYSIGDYALMAVFVGILILVIVDQVQDMLRRGP